MNLISVNRIAKSAGEKLLFRDASFGIDEGDKVALIGVNGTGKSTLLKLLDGRESPDEGEVMRNRELRIDFLEQSPPFREDDTILDHIFRSDSRVASLVKKYEDCCLRMERSYSQKVQEEYEALNAEMDRLDGWKYESRMKSILHELGITNLEARMGQLSGGMLKKVALARVLIDDSNLLILDEPTNHLDADAILWLEEYLQKTDRALVLVTHDRYFLDRVVNRIVEIDRQQISSFEGNYNLYLEKKVEQEQSLQRAEAKAKNFLRKELEWLKRQPKARGTKQKARIDRIHEVENRRTYGTPQELELNYSGRRLGKRILEAKGISKSFDNRVLLKDFEYIFKGNERIGIVGPNGSGKSTFLNILTGIVAPDSGEVVRGVNTHPGYFDQTARNLEGGMRVLEYVQKTAGLYVNSPDGSRISAGEMLERFLFPSHLQSLPVDRLSGGEKRRLYLVTILMSEPNFLILDEPTNDLDIQTLSVLEEFLDSFPGCVLVVSHDRYFLDRVVDTLFLFEGEGVVRGFPGRYSDFLEQERERKSQESTAKKREGRSREKPVRSPEKRKLSNREREELERLEREIDEGEREKAALEEFLHAPGAGYEELKEKGERYNQLLEELERKEERWEELLERDS